MMYPYMYERLSNTYMNIYFTMNQHYFTIIFKYSFDLYNFLMIHGIF
jgi:hypothetical protein